MDTEIRDATRGDTAGPIAWGIGATAALGALIVAGSRNLAHFDAALVAYTCSVLFATRSVVLVQEGAGVPRLRGLCRREIAILPLRHGEEAVPVGRSLGLGCSRHAQRLTLG